MPKQTGTKTPEPSEMTPEQALKHGLTADRMFVLANENERKWAAILKSWTDKLQARDEAEFMIVEDIAHAQWRIRRARTWEGSIIDVEMEEQEEIMAATYDPVDEGTRQACAFKALGDKSRCLDHLHRYETRARRAFKQGIAALEQLRALTAAPAPAAEPRKPEPVPEPKPELKPKPAPEPKVAAPAPPAKEDDEHLPPQKPVRAAVRFPNMPKHLRKEWDYLQKTIPNFDSYWHYERMSPELQKWVNKIAA